jgi:Damage-control phosphatase ARMT1-like domain
MPNLPPELLNDDPGGYAWGVWHDRTPRLISQIRDAHPYGAAQRGALDSLWQEVSQGPIQPLDSGAHGADQWASWAAADDEGTSAGKTYLGLYWAQASFLWSESYFFRRLLEAVGFFKPGPWYYVDPFGYLKTAELHDQNAETVLAAIGDLDALPAAEQAQAKLLASLWGNRADLGFRIGRIGQQGEPEQGDPEQAGLVADQSAEVQAALEAAADIILVADNAGRELLADLVLIDHLLTGNQDRTVSLHLKPYPYYVSDATTADAAACLDRLTRTKASASTAARLKTAAAEGRFRFSTHEFYCAPLPYHRMPADLAAQFLQVSLTIMKGDLNYRRLVGDRAWPPSTPFGDAVSYFPGPVAALRTLKSDVITGLDHATISMLGGAEGSWRTDGSHALIQWNRPG